MEYITNDQLVFVLKTLYPNLTPGTNFRVQCFFTEDTFKELAGDAQIYEWPEGIEQPTPEAIRAAWDGGLNKAFDLYQKAQQARWDREPLLREADAMVYRAEDAGDAERVGAARKYRQALRDVPQQPGFPDTVVWPPLP